MGENKKLRKQRRSIELKIESHLLKIDKQASLPSPDWGLIRHWQREIANWERQIEEIDRKLRKR